MQTANTGTRLVTSTRASSAAAAAWVNPIAARAAVGRKPTTCQARRALMPLGSGKPRAVRRDRPWSEPFYAV